MGLSKDLENAASKLKRSIDDGVDVREAVRSFAQDVEKAAKSAAEKVRALSET